MNILITWWRSYVALSLVKLARHQENFCIYVWDTNTRWVTFSIVDTSHHLTYPSPRFEFENFKKKVCEIIKTHKIEEIYSTCEDVFYFAKIQDEIRTLWCNIQVSSIETLDRIHSKSSYISTLKWIQTPILLPKTYIINPSQNRYEKIQSLKGHVIFKYDYSRFAQHIYTNFSSKQFPHIQTLKKLHYPLVAQEFIPWDHICNFSRYASWVLQSCISYKNKISLKWGSWTYITETYEQDIQDFCEEFWKHLRLEWWVSFDFIKNNSWIYTIECNPRITSWIHLYDSYISLSNVIFLKDSTKNISSRWSNKSTFILTNIIFHLHKIFSYPDAFKRKYAVCYEFKHLMVYQIYLVFYYFSLSLKKWISLTEVLTEDIEYNGPNT